MRKFFKKEDGAVLMLFALLMPVVLGCAAMVVDFGIQYGSKVRLQNIAQTAALAASQDALQDPPLPGTRPMSTSTLTGSRPTRRRWKSRSRRAAPMLLLQGNPIIILPVSSVFGQRTYPPMQRL